MNVRRLIRFTFDTYEEAAAFMKAFIYLKDDDVVLIGMEYGTKVKIMIEDSNEDRATRKPPDMG